MDHTQIGDVEDWIKVIQEIQVGQPFPIPKFLRPYHLATLTHELQKMQISSLVMPQKLSSYANTMNLWGAAGLSPPADISTRHASGRYHPIEVLSDSRMVDTTTDQLIELFRPVCSDEDTLNAVDTMLRELIGNCFAHSAVKDDRFGLICAQAWSAGRKAQVAISDSGVGIKKSLFENPEYHSILDQRNSCEFATEYGVTSKPGKGHSGYGLAVARALIKQNNGSFFVRSGEECFHYCSECSESYSGLRQLGGTLLIIEWNLDCPMNISDVYEGWPQIEGMSDDDFDF